MEVWEKGRNLILAIRIEQKQKLSVEKPNELFLLSGLFFGIILDIWFSPLQIQ